MLRGSLDAAGCLAGCYVGELARCWAAGCLHKSAYTGADLAFFPLVLPPLSSIILIIHRCYIHLLS